MKPKTTSQPAERGRKQEPDFFSGKLRCFVA
jgi:hypothetical protein